VNAEPRVQSGGYHLPVMLREVVEAFAPAAQGIVMDGTAGGGGHTLALLEAYPQIRVVAVDRDPEAHRAVAARVAPYSDRVRQLHARFDEAVLQLESEAVTLAGALLDLGISSRQIDALERGFTHRDEARLDMRMGGETSGGETAADLLNERSEGELREIFWRLGEEPRGRALAQIVVRRRESKPFRLAGDLNEALAELYRRPALAKEKARIYQALRIEVNDELSALAQALPSLRDRLGAGGILAVLSYHSLEDRLVKNAFREWSRSCVCPPELLQCICRGEPLGRLVTRSARKPEADEVASNPRARSARFRVWEKAS
jgi:16S rRNA (cytosine1402-N4)-methyltransferase